jgi:hypothetical protein
MFKTSNTSARLASMEAQRAADEAAAARAREEQRQAEIKAGAQRINELFFGAPVYDYRDAMIGYNQNNLPEGWKVAGRDVTTTTPGQYVSNGGTGDAAYEWWQEPITTTMKKYGIYDPAGNLQTQEVDNTDHIHWAATLPGKEKYDTGERTGGIPESYYTGVADNIKALGTSDLTQQFNRARENLQYQLARSGLLVSSAANDGRVDLETARDEGAAKIGIQAAQAVQKQRQAVESERQTALNQLYATQNPDLAANTAMTNKTLMMQDKPSYSPIGDVFGAVLGGFSQGLGYLNNVNAGKVTPDSPSAWYSQSANERIVGKP